MKTYQVTLRGETFQFGLDDVVDYLAQYGVITIQEGSVGECAGWLSRGKLTGNTKGEGEGEGEYYFTNVRIYFLSNDSRWIFCPLGKNEHQATSRGTNQLDKAVEEYLEKIGKLETV